MTAFSIIVYGEVSESRNPEDMRATLQHLSTAIVAFAVAISAVGQDASGTAGRPQEQPQLAPAASLASGTGSNPETAVVLPAVQQLLAFKDSDVKFSLQNLMSILSDRRHEGWVLAAYPDPKTGRPLIGAGFSLDLPAREHPQRDPLNPRPFLEPSSAQLWQAAGLDSERLQSILDQYSDHLAAWSKRRYRNKIRTLAPQITNEEATLLLRISAIQSIYNAKAYCRSFDSLTSSQQLALSQLVYQMGVNLEEFSQFLNLINNNSGNSLPSESSAGPDAEYWTAVQHSLIQSQWATLYRVRAVSVIAMLDPQYFDDPAAAERRVSATLRPAVVHRCRGRSVASLRAASYDRHSGRAARRKMSRTRSN